MMATTRAATPCSVRSLSSVGSVVASAIRILQKSKKAGPAGPTLINASDTGGYVRMKN